MDEASSLGIELSSAIERIATECSSINTSVRDDSTKMEGQDRRQPCLRDEDGFLAKRGRIDVEEPSCDDADVIKVSSLTPLVNHEPAFVSDLESNSRMTMPGSCRSSRQCRQCLSDF
jgi:hypothetical protein